MYPKKKTAKLNPRKKNAPEKNSKFSPSKFKKYLETLKFREKKMNPRKNLKICPRKFQDAGENLGKNGRVKYIPPEKKKPQKMPTNVISGTFHFLG